MTTSDADIARGSLRVPCPYCGADEGIKCQTSSGRASRSSHEGRLHAYRARLRRRRFVVEVLRDDERLGLRAGEQYVAQAYALDPEKVTLIGRLPDGFDPQCNQYWTEVAWLSWRT